jgi:hypothetical protein
LAFLGPHASVTTTATQRIAVNVSASFVNEYLDGGRAVPDVDIEFGICVVVDGGIPSSPELQPAFATIRPGITALSVSTTFVPGGGTWSIGPCAGLLQIGVNTTVYESALSGWFIVTES